jgi:hypothetical protein
VTWSIWTRTSAADADAGAAAAATAAHATAATTQVRALLARWRRSSIWTIVPIIVRKHAAARTVAISICLAVAALLTTTAGAQAKEVPSGWSWTNYGPQLMAVSCVDADTCVAVGQGGAVLRSPNSDAIPLDWTHVALQRDPDPLYKTEPVDLVDVTCSASSCLAISNTPTPRTTYGSWVYRSVDHGVTWTPVQMLPQTGSRKTRSAAAIDCAPDPDPSTPTTHTCYAVGTGGGIWRSTDDGQGWTGVPYSAGTLGGAVAFDHVVCPNPDACIAAGGDTLPASLVIHGTEATLLKTPVGIDKRWAALACDTPTRCIGTGGVGGYSLITLDGSPAWGVAHEFREKKPLGLTVTAISCPVAGSCVGLTDSGLALRSDDIASADPRNWARRPVTDVVGALDCVAADCVAVGKMASWYASFDLGSNWGRVNEVAKFDVAQCSPDLAPTCVAGGKENVGVSRTGGTLWTLPIADHGALNTNSVNCTAPSTCLISGMTDMLYTTDLDVWRPRFGPVQSAAGSENQTCVTPTLCVAVNDGTVYTTFDAGVTPWSQNQFPHVRPAAGIACVPGRTDPVTCLVPVKDLILLGTMTQDEGGLPHWTWRYTNADSDEILNAVACDPTGAQCTAVGMEGTVLTTIGGSLLNWTAHQFPQLPPPVPEDALPTYTSVTCPQAGFCMAGGAHGVQAIVASTTNNWADYSYDEIGDIRASPILAGFSCVTLNRCLAVGSTALVGIRTPPITP